MRIGKFRTIAIILATCFICISLITCTNGLLQAVREEVNDYIESTGILAPATGLSTETSVITEISLQWDAVVGATNYQLFRAVNPDGPYTEIYFGTATSYRDLNDDLIDGQGYYYKVRSSDAERQSEFSPIIFILYDSTIPTVIITSPTDQFNSPDASFTISGLSSDNSGIAKIEIQVDDGPWTLAAGTTSWALGLSSLSNGVHILTVKVTDIDGKTNTEQVSVTVDTIFPSLTIISPLNNADLSDNTPTINGTAGDNYGLATVQLQINSGTWQSVTGTTSWTKTLSALANGTYGITVRAMDLAGNETEQTINVDIDSSDPLLTVTNPQSDLITQDTTPYFSGTASDSNGISSVQVRIDSGSWLTASGTTSWSLSPSVSYGDRIITIRAWDNFNNYTDLSRSITVLRTPISVSASDSDDDRITLTWTASSGSSVSYKVYRSTSSSSGYAEIGTSSGNSYTDLHTSCDYRTSYYYRVSAVKGTFETTQSSYNSGFRHGFYELDSSIGSYGTADDRMYRPTDVSFDGMGYLFVSDTYHSQIDLWSSTPEYYDSLGSYQDGSGSGMSRPTGIKRHDLDTFYVGDSYNYEVDRWEFDYNSMSWEYNSSFSATGFGYPQSLDTDSNYVFVSQTTSSTIWRFTLAGVYSTKWGSTGSGNGQFNGLRGLTVSGSYVYAVDRTNNRVQIFTKSGTYVSQFPVEANSWGIDITTGSYIVVTNDSGFNLYTSGGVLVSDFTNDPLFNLAKGVRSYSTQLYIADYNNCTIRKFLLK